MPRRRRALVATAWRAGCPERSRGVPSRAAPRHAGDQPGRGVPTMEQSEPELIDHLAVLWRWRWLPSDRDSRWSERASDACTYHAATDQMGCAEWEHSVGSFSMRDRVPCTGAATCLTRGEREGRAEPRRCVSLSDGPLLVRRARLTDGRPVNARVRRPRVARGLDRRLRRRPHCAAPAPFVLDPRNAMRGVGVDPMRIVRR